MKNKVLITGGTGLIGTAVRQLLNRKGYETAVLTRNKNLKNIKSFYWNPPTKELDLEALKFADYIIHLAGENISKKRWTARQKQRIYDSRIHSTRFLFDKVKASGLYPKKLISASAIGYYGTFTSDKILTENDPPGNDFLAKVVVDWEKENLAFEKLGIPTLLYRIGVVFSNKGGALGEMMKTIPLGFVASPGSGKQILAWIALEDLAEMFVYGIENENLTGIYNAVSPNPVNVLKLNNELAKKYKIKHLPIHIPKIFLKLAFGEMSSLILEGSKISSEKIINSGFQFKYPQIRDIL